MTVRMVRFQGWRTGLVVEAGGERVVDLVASLPAFARERPAEADLLRSLLPAPEGGWEPLVRAWAEARVAVEDFLNAAAGALEAGPTEGWVAHDLDQVALEAPLPSRELRIFAAGGNFADHVARIQARRGEPVTAEEVAHRAQEEKRAGAPPWGFLVVPGLVRGDGATVEPPRGTRYLDYEAEVAAVLAEGGRDLSPEQVRFWAVAPFNDLSLRDGQEGGEAIDRGHYTWALSKNFESGKSCGPWLTVADRLAVDRLEVRCHVNGALRQEFSTAAMLYSFGELAAFLSRFVELRPGDVITSGTGAGTALDSGRDRYLRPGDLVEVEVSGFGRLRNRVAG
ncbi:MAG TPA: fumarylacetoacetate hydrolase family protein [Candidatus Dormibacteraeota bacterium]|nr:fumarylacetoacetate hydrolase family protein [Candidatus Dormibacteraeota bacterium]